MGKMVFRKVRKMDGFSNSAMEKGYFTSLSIAYQF